MNQHKFSHLNDLLVQALIKIEAFKSAVYYDAELANLYHKSNRLETSINQIREDLSLHNPLKTI